MKTRLAELQQQYCISTQRRRRHASSAALFALPDLLEVDYYCLPLCRFKEGAFMVERLQRLLLLLHKSLFVARAHGE